MTCAGAEILPRERLAPGGLLRGRGGGQARALSPRVTLPLLAYRERMSRLGHIAAGLHERVSGLSAPAQRAMMKTVLVAAVRESGLTDDRALRCLDAFLAEAAAVSGAAAAAADDLETAAWKAQDEGDDSQYLVLWRQARAAAAVASALVGNHRTLSTRARTLSTIRSG